MERFLTARRSSTMETAPESAAAPSSPKQTHQIQETSTKTPTGQHIKVTLERMSEGGTRHEANFTRAAPESAPMTAAERARKKRALTALYPDHQAEVRARDSARKRSASSLEGSQVEETEVEESEVKQANESQKDAIDLSDSDGATQGSQAPQQPPHVDCYFCRRHRRGCCDSCPFARKCHMVNSAAEWLCMRDGPGSWQERACTMQELLSCLCAVHNHFCSKMREWARICRPYRYVVEEEWLRKYLDDNRFMLVSIDRTVHLL